MSEYCGRKHNHKAEWNNKDHSKFENWIQQSNINIEQNSSWDEDKIKNSVNQLEILKERLTSRVNQVEDRISRLKVMQRNWTT